MVTEQNYMDHFTGLVAARYRLEVSRVLEGDDASEEWSAKLWKTSIRTRTIMVGTLVESHASTKAQAVLGVYSCALGEALASLDRTSCDVCGQRIGLMGGRDAKSGKVVCPKHVTRVT